MSVAVWIFFFFYHVFLPSCLRFPCFPQGHPGSDGPPGKEGLLGQRVGIDQNKSLNDVCRFTILELSVLSPTPRGIEVTPVQRACLVLRDFLALQVLSVQRVVQEEEETL